MHTILSSAIEEHAYQYILCLRSFGGLLPVDRLSTGSVDGEVEDVKPLIPPLKVVHLFRLDAVVQIERGVGDAFRLSDEHFPGGASTWTVK